MADLVFSIDVAGRLSFYGMSTHAPTLKKTMDELLAGGGCGGGMRTVPGAAACGGEPHPRRRAGDGGRAGKVDAPSRLNLDLSHPL